MQEKLNALLLRMQTALRRNPVEVALSVIFCVLGCWRHEIRYADDESLKWVLCYYPVFFLASYSLNGLTAGRRTPLRWLYYLSAAFFIPFFWLETDSLAVYFVSLAVIQSAYWVSTRQKDNFLFIQSVLRYLQSLLFAVVLATVAWLLSLSVFFSIRYIFEIFEYSEERFIAYSASVAYFLMLSLLFLTFNDREETGMRITRLFSILLNYVLSPALLAYAVILYIYFIKITLLWSLPKGGVAYIVIAFVSVTFLLKGCQPFLQRRYYDWYYRYASWYVLPALGMFWAGAFYRIGQYGYTQDRVYLAVLGAFLSVCTLLFFSKRWGRYWYMAWIGIALLSVFTYIPGISASRLGLRSQEKRFDETAVSLGLFTSGGPLSYTRTLPADTTGIKEKYRRLYEAFLYVAREESESVVKNKYGLASSSVLLDSVIPAAYRAYAEFGEYSWYDEEPSFTLERRSAAVNVAGFRALYPVHSYQYANCLEQKVERNRLILSSHSGSDPVDSVYFRMSVDSLWNGILLQAGVEASQALSRDSLEKLGERILYYDTGSGRLVLERLVFSDTEVPEIKEMEVEYFLEK